MRKLNIKKGIFSFCLATTLLTMGNNPVFAEINEAYDEEVDPIILERKVKKFNPQGETNPGILYLQEQGIMREKQLEQSNADTIAVTTFKEGSDVEQEGLKAVKSIKRKKKAVRLGLPTVIVAAIGGVTLAGIILRKQMKREEEEELGLY